MLIIVYFVTPSGFLGAHTLSGAVLEPRALNELIPDWKERGVSENDMLFFVNKSPFFVLLRHFYTKGVFFWPEQH